MVNGLIAYRISCSNSSTVSLLLALFRQARSPGRHSLVSIFFLGCTGLFTPPHNHCADKTRPSNSTGKNTCKTCPGSRVNDLIQYIFFFSKITSAKAGYNVQISRQLFYLRRKRFWLRKHRKRCFKASRSLYSANHENDTVKLLVQSGRGPKAPKKLFFAG